MKPAAARIGRRFTDHTPPGNPLVLAADHPAIVEGTTMFRARRIAPGSERLLKSAGHNRKIGAVVAKGRWRGMPIFTLTLEERATCWTGCAHWRDCYGNRMNWSRRIAHGPDLERLLAFELGALQQFHPHGFVVRLHVLGDFYSLDYVRLWRGWLKQFPALRVYGYTAWTRATPIGALIDKIAAENWDRFSVRISNGAAPARTTRSIDDVAHAGPAIVCPVQTGKTDCCATCALCWHTQQPIAFLTH